METSRDRPEIMQVHHLMEHARASCLDLQFILPETALQAKGAEEQERYLAKSSDNLTSAPRRSRYDKSETVTNCLIIEYLQHLAKCNSGPNDRKFHLEWATAQDAF